MDEFGGRKSRPRHVEPFDAKVFMRRPADSDERGGVQRLLLGGGRTKLDSEGVKHEPPTIDVEKFTVFSLALLELTKELTNPRLTLRQALFFIVFAAGDLNEIKRTLADVRDRPISEDNPTKLFGESIESSYTIFLEGKDGLGWLEQAPDPLDKRRKLIKLTDKGREVVARIAAI
jgi:hypothetical protein